MTKEHGQGVQTSQIINRLEKLVKGEIEMTSQQVRAAEILLRKTLPDMQAIKHTAATDGQITIFLQTFAGSDEYYEQDKLFRLSGDDDFTID